MSFRSQRKLPRVPWTDRKTNISILNEINPVRFLESQICKQRLTYFRHIMRAKGLEKLFMLGNIEGREEDPYNEMARRSQESYGKVTR
ncbi:hypothetical protein LAZ67_3000273 [Cordylochernes scorpioides]|uniref:Myotubularin phosphatase domain-containing protein n=1 Tax=Cordylochernes scorpioides TaxID=51811 RepID=A0ABY6K638_9ARAC|nr:hypothetical protein LAZ67_3000273 [Cordylochernes scorpioides]